MVRHSFLQEIKKGWRRVADFLRMVGVSAFQFHSEPSRCWCKDGYQTYKNVCNYFPSFLYFADSAQLRMAHTHTHTHTRLTALFPRLPRWVGTRKVKPIWILLKQETVSGSGISLAICKSAPRSRQITTPAPHTLFFYRPDGLPAAQPTASKHWRQSA